MADTALTDAIAQAEKELKGEEEEPEVKVDVEEEKQEPESDDEPDFSKEQETEAKLLYKALRDPKTSGPIIAALAQQAGLHLSPTSTKSEVKEVETSIKDAVKASLGKQYEFLADQIGSAIEAALTIHGKAQETKFAEIRQAQIEKDVVTAYEKLAKETKGESKRLEARMAGLSEEVPIGKMDVETYIRRLYAVANSESQKTSARQVADKIRRNSNDAPDRLRGTAAGKDTVIPDKKMNLKESVEFALNTLKEKGK